GSRTVRASKPSTARGLSSGSLRGPRRAPRRPRAGDGRAVARAFGATRSAVDRGSLEKGMSELIAGRTLLVVEDEPLLGML
ncbi:hypothetical protein NK936_24305, partial [Salmonella enterica subsp. enterica serovar Typhimurium]|uniref:hypothetical protein n=1 Tax=Salmonella enterica TaxID=28901 RepID=UPI0020A56A2E